jgi:adenine-specific DNA-methyltransferase
MGTGADFSAREILTLARSAASELRGMAPTATRRLSFCKHLLAEVDDKQSPLKQLSDALDKLTVDTRHYWIGTLYSLLLQPADRRRQAVYFTPPHLAEAIVGLLVKEGFDLHAHTVIDPAAGGAAFLSTIASKMAQASVPISTITKNLHGIEIDSGLARLSEILIAERLGRKIKKASIVRTGDSLAIRRHGTYDLVIANPPYGRLTQTSLKLEKWRNVCYSGHINKYALFAELCCKLAKENGLIALVIPSSLVAGPLYDLLRTHLRKSGQLLLIGSVPHRHDVFADVAQDVSVLLLRKGTKHDHEKSVVFGRFATLGGFKARAAVKLPEQDGSPWPVPARSRGLCVGGSTLSSYGAKVRAGYFVWNREGERMTRRQYSKLYVPLIWAKNVKPGAFCKPRSKDRQSTDFVRFSANTSAIIRTNAIILQRTTNNAQKRRLVAARISPSVLKKWGGFITENHTLVVTAENLDTLNDLCTLLNSKAVDLRYRQVSGTASVSVTLLRNLDLPDPAILRHYLSSMLDPEKAIDAAYAESNSPSVKAVA